ncbi:hypothetical protein AB1399_03310 [Hydrogenibacillus schlegelii]|uniref:Uncharacterized protein n=1 Tax=Hydrogenibacillus schlegelii TaxID=1484 RepID=A0A132N389_HYDSH|nr:hypothetical protein [Hydrogenibacillus schlegelii]KWX04615.1 hypothetical protein TR75_08275 [Hydrogenibacillus schlegelii]OAR03216.1 hypothetical protein SA87_04820 [Hydrogenibacillus schlegelii]
MRTIGVALWLYALALAFGWAIGYGAGATGGAGVTGPAAIVLSETDRIGVEGAGGSANADFGDGNRPGDEPSAGVPAEPNRSFVGGSDPARPAYGPAIAEALLVVLLGSAWFGPAALLLYAAVWGRAVGLRTAGFDAHAFGDWALRSLPADAAVAAGLFWLFVRSIRLQAAFFADRRFGVASRGVLEALKAYALAGAGTVGFFGLAAWLAARLGG